MLFRSRGQLCTATVCQALAQAAHGQTGETPSTPSPVCPVSEADSCKTEEPLQVPPGPRTAGLGLLLSVIDIRPKIQFATMYDDKIAV